MKKERGITLISLVITIIILLILAGVTINLTIGENGIFKVAEDATEEHKKAEIKERLEDAIINIQTKRIVENQNITRDDLRELANIGAIMISIDTPALGEYNDYEFTINEKYEVTIGKKLQGNKPAGKATVITEGQVPKGKKVSIKVMAEEHITSITAVNGAVLKEDETNTDTEKVFEVEKNGLYYFIITGSNGRKNLINVEVNTILEEPKISIDEITEVSFKIKIDSNFAEEIVEQYKYYVNGEIVNEGTTQKEFIVKNLCDGKQYSNIYVEAYFKNDTVPLKSKEMNVSTLALEAERQYLYRFGSKFTERTGGFKYNVRQGWGVTTQDNSDNLYMRAASVYGKGYGEIELYAQKPIDVTNYSKLCFDMDYYVGYGEAAWRTKLYYGLSGLTLTEVSGTNSSSNNIIKYDISNIEGLYNPYIRIYSASSRSSVWVTIRQIYLEK